LVRHAGLELCTPWGETTHESREDRDSTIDLAWATADLNAQWEGSRSLEGSDHRAQVVSVGAAPLPAGRPAGWSWAQMDREKVKAQATHLTVPKAEDITTAEQLEEAVDSLVSQLHQVADFSTPRAKVNTGQRAGWWDLSTKKQSRRPGKRGAAGAWSEREPSRRSSPRQRGTRTR